MIMTIIAKTEHVYITCDNLACMQDVQSR